MQGKHDRHGGVGCGSIRSFRHPTGVLEHIPQVKGATPGLDQERPGHMDWVGRVAKHRLQGEHCVKDFFSPENSLSGRKGHVTRASVLHALVHQPGSRLHPA